MCLLSFHCKAKDVRKETKQPMRGQLCRSLFRWGVWRLFYTRRNENETRPRKTTSAKVWYELKQIRVNKWQQHSYLPTKSLDKKYVLNSLNGKKKYLLLLFFLDKKCRILRKGFSGCVFVSWAQSWCILMHDVCHSSFTLNGVMC